jgi:ABC-type transport system substrate-binding protein
MLRTFLEFSTPVFRDSEILDLLARARSLTDQDARLRLYQEAERRLIREQAAVVPLPYTTWKTMSRPWVQGFSATVDFGLPSLDQVVIRR